MKKEEPKILATVSLFDDIMIMAEMEFEYTKSYQITRCVRSMFEDYPEAVRAEVYNRRTGKRIGIYVRKGNEVVHVPKMKKKDMRPERQVSSLQKYYNRGKKYDKRYVFMADKELQDILNGLPLKGIAVYIREAIKEKFQREELMSMLSAQAPDQQDTQGADTTGAANH